MSYRTFHISYSSKDGFILHLVERSVLKDLVEEWAGWLCMVTGHHGCNSWFGRIANWADKSEVTLDRIPILRSNADALAFEDDTWTWLDDDDS